MGGSARLPPVTINPWGDSLPPSPIDWEDVPLGDGQEPARPNAHFQHTKNLPSDPTGRDVRRTPGYEHMVVISRWPERPA